MDMKKLAAALCLTLAVLLGNISWVHASSDTRMTPLVEIINEFKSGPDTQEGCLHFLSLAGVRCGGFFGAMASLTSNEQLAKVSMNMAQVTAVTESFGTKTDLVSAFEAASEEVMRTKNRYRSIMISNNTLNGNYFKGSPLLDGDYSACKEMMPTMLDFVKQAGIPLIK